MSGHPSTPAARSLILGRIRDILGEDFVTAYTTLRRYELQRFEDHVTDWEFAEYAELF